MLEDKKEVKVYRVEAICTECYEGKMKSTGVMLTSNPPWYPHVCNNCGYKENLRKQYPCLDYYESSV